MKINFSKEEMAKFLRKKGYSIKKIKVWESYPVYHNDVETSYSYIEIAYKGDFPKLESTHKNSVEHIYGLEETFNLIMKQTLLSL